MVRDVVYAAAAALTWPIWGYRLLRTGRWRRPWADRCGQCQSIPNDGRKTLLIHAVSVGEINAIRKLVSMMGAGCQQKALRIVVSATTDTGFSRARQLFEPPHRVVRYPFDLGRCVKRFLDAIRPDAVALTELEVWPTFVDECNRRGVPVCVINGRLSARSYRWYRPIRALIRPTFGKLAAVAAQSQQYASRFVALGVPADRVQVIDSMKWDTDEGMARSSGQTGMHAHNDRAGVAGTADLAQAMGIDRSRPVIVAGSTGPGEEAMLLDHCPPDVQLVIAPRKPERFDEVAEQASGIVRRSEHPDGRPASPRGQTRFLLDTIGELRKAYALADVAIVGRSFLGTQHGSNPLEPVALGIPTIIGPHHDDFAQLVDTLKAGGGILVSNHPGQAAAQLLTDTKQAHQLAQCGIDVILSRRGTTEKHVELLWRIVNSRTRP